MEVKMKTILDSGHKADARHLGQVGHYLMVPSLARNSN